MAVVVQTAVRHANAHGSGLRASFYPKLFYTLPVCVSCRYDANPVSERTLVHLAAFSALFGAFLRLYFFPVFVVTSNIFWLCWLLTIEYIRYIETA